MTPGQSPPSRSFRRIDRPWRAPILTLCAAALLAACSGDDGDGNPPPAVTLASITLAPADISLEPGETQQLTVTGRYSDNSTATLTTGVTFESSSAHATVSATGLVTAVSAGSATITATASGRTGTASVTVTSAAAPGAIFLDDYAEGVSFVAFEGSANDLAVDTSEQHAGTSSLRVAVPATGYTGGALVASADRDLSGFNAVTFWVKASKDATLDVAGLGNDAGAGPSWSAEVTQIPVGGVWTKVIVPLPVPAKATAIDGLFHFAEGSDQGAYTIWLDDIQYENLSGSTLAAPTAASIAWSPVQMQLGASGALGTSGGNTVTYALPALPDGGNLKNVAFRWFTLTSGTPGVATVDADGVVTAVAEGTSSVTADLGTVDVPGEAVVTVVASIAAPATAAPTPSAPAGDVISLYSDAYTNVPVDTWKTVWSPGAVVLTDPYDIPGTADDAKKYEFFAGANFAGVEFVANMIDASAMTHFHVDVWTPDATNFQVKLVDFGANGQYEGPGVVDDTEGIVTLTAGSSPPLSTGTWLSYDLPLSAFTGLANRAHLAQLVFVSGTGAATVYVDNVYFYRSAAPVAPTTAAPTPDEPAASVISLYSAAYSDVPVDTWRTSWTPAGAVLTDPYAIPGTSEEVKRYAFADADNNYAGVEFVANMIDASAMTHFHVDVWTPDATNFQVKLVDFGVDGAFGGGDDTEGTVTLTAASTPPLATGAWLSYDLPLSAFTGLANRAHLAQLVFVSGAGTATVFLDNLYFYAAAAPGSPTSAAPTPSAPAGDVISLYSDAYTNVPVDTWKTVWSPGAVVLTDPYDIPGTADDAKKYEFFAGANFAGVEFVGPNLIDASAMTHFHVDVWTPDATNFQVKLVDFGANGVYDGGGDDTEGILTLTAGSTPPLTQGGWVSYDVPFADFPGLAARAHLAQMVLVSGAGAATVYLDNVYFHR